MPLKLPLAFAGPPIIHCVQNILTQTLIQTLTIKLSEYRFCWRQMAMKWLQDVQKLGPSKLPIIIQSPLWPIVVLA